MKKAKIQWKNQNAKCKNDEIAAVCFAGVAMTFSYGFGALAGMCCFVALLARRKLTESPRFVISREKGSASHILVQRGADDFGPKRVSVSRVQRFSMV